MFALVCAAFGLIIGSFLNVAILRRSVRSLGGRSVCFSCGNAIAWYDNIPLLSYAFLLGRCRRCGSRISPQYPLVELGTALLFFAVALALGVPESTESFLVLGGSLLLAALLICVFVYDLRHTIIPDAWAYSFALCALVVHLADLSNLDLTLVLLAGPVVAFPLFVLWLISGGRWMGLGDAKLALGIGWLLGPIDGMAALFYAFVIGAIVSVAVLMPLPFYRRLVRRLFTWGLSRGGGSSSFTMKSEIPFGPFLVTSCIIIWLMHLYHVPVPL